MQSRPQLKSFLEYINGSVLNEEYLHQIPQPLISSWYRGWRLGGGAFCLQWHGGEGEDSSHWRGSLPPAGGSLPADSKSSSICKVCLCLSSSVFPPASVSGPLLSFLSVSVSICWALSHFYFLLLLLVFLPNFSLSLSLPASHTPPSFSCCFSLLFTLCSYIISLCCCF